MLTKPSKRLKLLFVIPWLIAFTAPGQGSVTVTVDAIENTDGNIVFMLFNREEGFPREVDQAWKTGKTKPQGKQATYTFADVPYGTYAIAVFHDEDDDGEVDTNFVGFPKERVGAANMRGLGKPSFRKSQVEIEEPAVTVPIQFIN